MRGTLSERPTNRKRGTPARPLTPVPAHETIFQMIARYLRRATAYAVFALALLALYLIVSPVLPDRYAFPPFDTGDGSPSRAEAAPAQALHLRPQGVPARIPSWAWGLHTWLLTPGSQRGARPTTAPRHVPAWFWKWHAWRVAIERHPS